METTFISIHTLGEDARILYSSDSIVDILGYTPEEVVNRSAWNFFLRDEVVEARKFHQKRVLADKAAVLAYCRIQDKTGQWVGCECCFTIVYDVMVVCTSIYSRGMRSHKRAVEAPMVRRIFTSSPKDPRYHMLSHMSAKFAQPAKMQQHEPRAALFLNRFTRTLTIMYATSGIEDIFGVPAEAMRGRSFYYCISENCLEDAVKCLENAKGNDSIAYLRFWFRDPRQDDPPASEIDSDEEMMTDASESALESESPPEQSSGSDSPYRPRDTSGMDLDDETKPDSRNSSGDSNADTHEAIFGDQLRADSSASSVAQSPETGLVAEPIEIEAVISCASDGLVVCLRKARPMIPHPTQRPTKPVYQNGLFAAPWATEPVVPRVESRPGYGFGSAFAPSLGPHGAHQSSVSPPRARPTMDHSDFMNAIRDQAVFAWGLTAINGSLAQYGHGKPIGDAVPDAGLPVWQNDAKQSIERNDSGNMADGQDGVMPPPAATRDDTMTAQIFGSSGHKRARSEGSPGSWSNGNDKTFSRAR